MRGRGHGRRATLVAATVLTAVLLGAAAHADPGTSGNAPGTPVTPVIPGQGAIDRARADVRDRHSAADRLQAALDAANSRLHAMQASAGLQTEAYDAAMAQAATAAQAAAEARTRAVAALDAQHQAEARLGAFAAQIYRQGPDMVMALALLQAGSLHDYAVRSQILANRDAAEALAVFGARQATKDVAAARQRADQTAADQRRAEARAVSTLAAARAAAAAAQRQVAGIRAQQNALLRQLAKAQGIEVGLERQRQARLAALVAQRAAARQAAAAARAAAASVAAAGSGGSAHAASGGGASSTSPGAPTGPVPDARGSVRLMLRYVYAQLGKPYVWGGAGPDVFDCSGLAMRGLEAGGWSFPHPAQWQYLAMHPLTYNKLRPGDLVFWAEDDSDPHTIYHEAVYIGKDRIIQAPRPGGVVEEQSMWINGTPSFYGRP